VPGRDLRRILLVTSDYPLFLAAAHGRTVIIREFIAAHRQAFGDRSLSEEQQTVLDLCLKAAAKRGNVEMAKRLVESGAQVSIYGPGLYQATIPLAMTQDHLDIVEYLLPFAPKDDPHATSPPSLADPR